MIEYINGQDRCDVQLMYNGSSITQKQITGEGITAENTIWVTRMSFDFKAAELYYIKDGVQKQALSGSVQAFFTANASQTIIGAIGTNSTGTMSA